MSILRHDGTPGKILQDIIAVRKYIGGFQAKKLANGPQYPVKSAKELFIKLREAGDELGMPMCGSPVAQDVKVEPTDRGSKVVITTTVRFMSSDGSYVDYVGTGGGMAPDDKGAGKANTYSKKVACLEGLGIPDAELPDTDDEELLPHVYDLVERVNKAKTLADLKAMKPELEKLTKAHEKEAVMPAYIRRAGELKGT